MSAFEFSPSMRLALDAYRVPALPEGFADRVVARALAESRQRAAPPVRTTRWRRTGRIVTGAALAGLLTATAAAAGWFGKPVYVPVISEIIERIAPKRAEAVQPALVPTASIAPAPEPAPLLEPVTPLAPAPVPAPLPEFVAPVREPQIVAPAAVAPPAQIETPAPDPAARAELRREPLPLTPQRTPVAPEPEVAPTRTAIEPVAPIEPVVRPTATPTRKITPVPRDIRPTERVRVPTETRVPRTPTTTERRQQVRERRIP